MDDQNTISTAIHLYQPTNDEWVKVGDMPTSNATCKCTSIALPNGELLVLGGNNYMYNKAYMATLEDL